MEKSQELQSQSLISESYRLEQEKLHSKGNYGVMGGEYAPMVSQLIEKFQIKHLLDYGCGSRLSLYKGLRAPHKLTYQAYDPGVEQYASRPVPAEMVACIDVLEHIEPECLDAVLDDLKRCTEGILFATVATGPAGKTLSDGRNAHLIQKDMDFWLPKFWERFDIQSVTRVDNGFMVVAYCKSTIERVDGGRA